MKQTIVLAGSLSTLLSKYLNLSKSENRIGIERNFKHPFLQTAGKFAGEFVCLLLFYLIFLIEKLMFSPISKPNQNFKNVSGPKDDFNPKEHLEENNLKNKNETNNGDELSSKLGWKKSWILFFPALCDILASTVLYIGLSLTKASSYQMLRGSVIIFTGLLSRIFLNRRLKWYQWLAMAVILLGLFMVGISDVVATAGSTICENSKNYSMEVQSSVNR